MKISKTKKMYSIKEAMVATGLSKNSIYKEINSGNLSAKKFGNRTLIPSASFEAWLNNLPEKE